MPVAPFDVLADPRPDLAEDSDLWAGLLASLVDAHASEPFSAQHVARCVGARLEWTRDTLRLVPGKDPVAYAVVRELYLKPQTDAVVAVLCLLTARALDRADRTAA